MQKQRGFTLIELLVAMAIIGILVRLAAPSFIGMIRSSNMTSAVNSYLADLRYARSEAIRRGAVVIMCRSDTPEAAVPSCGTGSASGWETGWIIFQDANSNADYAAGEPLLRVQAAVTAVNVITDSVGSTKFQFTATGQLKSNVNSTITFGGAPLYTTTTKRVVCVTLGGRGKVAGDGTATCP